MPGFCLKPSFSSRNLTGSIKQSHGRERRHRFARTTFINHSQRFALTDTETTRL